MLQNIESNKQYCTFGHYSLETMSQRATSHAAIVDRSEARLIGEARLVGKLTSTAWVLKMGIVVTKRVNTKWGLGINQMIIKKSHSTY